MNISDMKNLDRVVDFFRDFEDFDVIEPTYGKCVTIQFRTKSSTPRYSFPMMVQIGKKYITIYFCQDISDYSNKENFMTVDINRKGLIRVSNDSICFSGFYDGGYCRLFINKNGRVNICIDNYN